MTVNYMSAQKNDMFMQRYVQLITLVLFTVRHGHPDYAVKNCNR